MQAEAASDGYTTPARGPIGHVIDGGGWRPLERASSPAPSALSFFRETPVAYATCGLVAVLVRTPVGGPLCIIKCSRLRIYLSLLWAASSRALCFVSLSLSSVSLTLVFCTRLLERLHLDECSLCRICVRPLHLRAACQFMRHRSGVRYSVAVSFRAVRAE